MKVKKNSLAERLDRLLEETKGQAPTFKYIIDSLAGRGQAALLVLLVLPFCQPIQIPGFSTIFGIVLMFIGLRIAFGHRTWIPATLLERKVPHSILEKIASAAIKITNKLSFLTSTRWVYLVNNPKFHVVHGIVIAILAFLLSLPLPIPFTNLFAAFPILAFGLGLLEDDGVMIVIGYVLFIFCIGVFSSLIFLGKSFLASIF